MHSLRMVCCLCFGILALSSARAETADDRRHGRPTAGDILVDAGQFVKDSDTETADIASVDADRAAMAIDLNNATALPVDVKKFFADRSAVGTIDDTVVLDRQQLRRDVKPNTGPLSKPGKGSSDLTTAVKQFQTDFNARVAAEAAVDTDYANLKISLFQQDRAGVTSNGNTYFHDRHNFFQNRLDEAADVFTIKKIEKFKGQKIALVKPVKGNALTAHVQQFLNDRAAWLADEAAITAARNNMFAAIGTSSFEATVMTWLNARHTHFVAGVQLGIDRFAMKVDVGLARQRDKGQTKSSGRGDGVEDNQDKPVPALDQSDEDNGEK